VTSQIPVQGWYDIIGEKTIADAILDRLIHQSHRLELHGESMRKKRGINKG
jgi:DNA replication protein DnaC